jgi:hypothetical protein
VGDAGLTLPWATAIKRVRFLTAGQLAGYVERTRTEG